jgi:hypothetical protein
MLINVNISRYQNDSLLLSEVDYSLAMFTFRSGQTAQLVNVSYVSRMAESGKSHRVDTYACVQD